MEQGTRAEIEADINKAEKAIAAAKHLLSGGFYNDALARSYYAMFYAVSGVIKTKGLSSSKHSGVITLFNQHFIKTGILQTSFHDEIKIAFLDRLKADYDTRVKISREKAENSLQRGERFVTQIKQFLKTQGWL